LINAIREVMEIPDDDKVNLRGKFYTQVAQRVQSFRLNLGSEGRIRTEVVENNDKKVVVEATISVWYKDVGWVEVANDFAEEYRAQGPVNKTSALENACTSAIGRALSACGLSGNEYASSFEVENAIHSKPSAPTPKPEPKAKAKSPEKPKAKEPEPEPEPEDDLGVVKKLLEEAMYIHPSVAELRDFWSVNKKNLDRMQAEEPDMYADVLKKFKTQAEELGKLEEANNG
jgi:hypothetical protein